MGFAVALEDGRTACAESIEALLRAAEGFSEHELLGASRCHGWTRLDVLTHVIGGWQEMLAGLVSLVDAEPTVDAASYWTAFADESFSEDRVATLMFQRRRTDLYARPASVIAHLNEVGEALTRGVGGLPDRACRWQGQVFAPGDFLAVWAVEDVVHHLDLQSPEPPPASALGLSRATIEALLGEPLPRSWTDEEATLIGTGRSPVPVGLSLADRLPAFG